jgi:lipopolysaccharide transport system ATP-binding protein
VTEVGSFAELGEAMDQPVRTYSSGMRIRLAFSVATVRRPDVLLVDEALAVGDIYFQHKSIRRIRSFREQGTTLLLVTHDPAALKALCERAILLDHGLLIRDGPAEAVFDYYNGLIARREGEAEVAQIKDERGRAVTRSGSREAEIVALDLCDPGGQPRRSFQVGDSVTIRYRVRLNRAMPMPTVGFLIRDRHGADVFGTNTFLLGVERRDCASGVEVSAVFEVGLYLGPGSYSLSVTVHAGRTHLEGNYDWWDQALAFQVTPGGSYEFAGTAALPVRVTVGES